MKDDRELLELAAKAAGIELEGDLHSNPGEWVPMYYEGKTYHSWSPLTDDGDALRLAVKLRFQIDVEAARTFVGSGLSSNSINRKSYESEQHHEDMYAATRRAIVRAAAEIGKQRSGNS
jgi:hypothetical protein